MKMKVQHIDDLTNLLVQVRAHAMSTRGAESIMDEQEHQALEKGAYDILAALGRVLDNINAERQPSLVPVAA